MPNARSARSLRVWGGACRKKFRAALDCVPRLASAGAVAAGAARVTVAAAVEACAPRPPPADTEYGTGSASDRWRRKVRRAALRSGAAGYAERFGIVWYAV